MRKTVLVTEIRVIMKIDFSNEGVETDGYREDQSSIQLT